MRGADQDWLQEMVQDEGTQAVGRHLEIVALFGVRSQRSDSTEGTVRVLASLLLLPAGGVIKPAL